MKFIKSMTYFGNEQILLILAFYMFFTFYIKFCFQSYGHKHIETGPDCSHELASFLKYYIPLKKTTYLLKFEKAKNCKVLFAIK